ncbi:hypothetical protein E4U42_007680 [Claviceps africana]|uniref:Large ribosomal subunit protein mL67 n=1 Tax=Claviceps africana TaxID=83212 RepID=A0A8K0NEH8_9HYPO|nr:hypothetical protein E4U42_007680 [Claviceps africana]
MNSAVRPRMGQWPTVLGACVRWIHKKSRRANKGKKQAPEKKVQGPEGHGENIWVFSHRRSDQIVYSFDSTLKRHHALKQMPFNGKKTKPATIRKDYWSPMAMIRFPKGQGEVGLSVYHKLRELKHLHEVAWTDEFRHKRPDEFTEEDKKKVAEEKAKGREYSPIRSKTERGIALNAQKTNSIADIAAVLAGNGKSNKVKVSAADSETPELVPVSVAWANEHDRQYAEAWSANVTHELFEQETGSSEGKVDPEAPAPVPDGL